MRKKILKKNKGCLLYSYLYGWNHRDRSKPRERMSLCTVLEAMWRIENKKSAVLKPKQNSKNIWQNLKNHFLIQFLELKIDFGLEIQHGKKNYTLKWECEILHVGLSTADSKQILCHIIFFKVLSLGLLQSLWLEPVFSMIEDLIYIWQFNFVLHM
jgi:hypothetical protein